MIDNIKYYIADNTMPYKNLAMEEYLLDSVEENQCILYLWQNRHTVVIGKNQNAYKECRVEALRGDGGFLVRRLSGGGSVFHDLGNLNFTFLIRDRHYDVSRQLSVIQRAVRKFGLNAEKSGRNDICIDGRKFSGNAFYKRGDHCYHHGTILINADMQNMSKYLNVSQDKLKANSVSSVKSRVINLKELNDEVNVENITEALVEAFGEEYGLTPEKIEKSQVDETIIQALTDKFSSEEFIFGRNMKADYEIKNRFKWGGIDLCFKISGDKIEDVMIYSDSMEWDFKDELEEAFKNIGFSKKELIKSLEGIKESLNSEIYEDLHELISQQDI
ncbi:lipoate--protein ligase [Anaeropeptidivorans aminofermentans]|jgi:lipoate-protein ligase A|uniref:lipoate--protein ligase n=1 Tax=Anaeropeptidivorans aminofermentans TaxID=2934315 RepID=UPI002025008E|nr:lipoate--protein ligase [Anaeropeptidivorans aminofermentans]